MSEWLVVIVAEVLLFFTRGLMWTWDHGPGQTWRGYKAWRRPPVTPCPVCGSATCTRCAGGAECCYCLLH